MPRILTDPALEVMPGYGSDTFAELRNMIRQVRNVDNDGAIEYLQDTWNTHNELNRVRWAEQEEEEAQVRQEQEEYRAREEERRERVRIAPPEAQEQAQQNENRQTQGKPARQIPQIDRTKSIGNSLLGHPGKYAMERLYNSSTSNCGTSHQKRAQTPLCQIWPQTTY
jgi:hypothetical protein